MKKIISLFQRNYDGDRLVRDEVVPGAEWVLAGEGTATRKWDGTSCLFRDGALFKRFDAKHGKPAPPGWTPCEPAPDTNTGHWPGWLPVGGGPEDRWHREALAVGCCHGHGHEPFVDGRTYELCGPKVNGNAEKFTKHYLVPHGDERLSVPQLTFDGIKAFLTTNVPEIEGIVWWREASDPDCDKVKIKRRDFGLPWPTRVGPPIVRLDNADMF